MKRHPQTKPLTNTKDKSKAKTAVDNKKTIVKNSDQPVEVIRLTKEFHEDFRAKRLETMKSKKHEDIDISQFSEITLDDVAKVLSLTIKDDDINKKMLFLGMLSAYTERDQINISLNAPSSTGKTYLAKEVAKLFPNEDKIELFKASPTAFFYGDGYWDKVHNVKYIDRMRKILIFYELPNPILQENLRPFLSHDDPIMEHSITNKNKGRHVADTIIVLGYSATVFCSANMVLDEQETTRSILLSPEATDDKIRQSIELVIKRGSNEEKFNQWLDSNPERIVLKNRILAIKNEYVQNIVIENEEAIKDRFLEKIGSTLQSRHSRDSDHMMQLIKAIALLNVWFRRQPDGTIVASRSDVDQAFELYDEIFESQELNVPPALVQFYKRYIVPAFIDKYKRSDSDTRRDMKYNNTGLSTEELASYHLKVGETTLNYDQLRKQTLLQLQNAGMIIWKKPKGDEYDKRTRHIFPQNLSVEDKNEMNIGSGGVDNDAIDKLSPETREMLFGKTRPEQLPLDNDEVDGK